jgi:DNA repair protein RadC
MKAQSEEAPEYMPRAKDDKIVAKALAILEARMKRAGPAMSSPQDVSSFIRLKLAGNEHEVFGVLFLNSQHNVIEFEEMFRGSVDSANVYPREIVKTALKHNAAAVVLAHNHPSGTLEPSRADEKLTELVKNALALVDVRVLDHFIVTGHGSMSFAEKGLI